MFDTSDIKVALLSGGSSNEREISLASGKGTKSGLEEAGFVVVDIDPANEEDLKKLISEEFDVAFLCLHGRGGEDGTIQGFLETIGLPYTGCGVLASALCMDKGKAKLVYEQAGVPTPKYIMITGDNAEDIKSKKDLLDKKVVIKAAHEGSSIGVFITDNYDDAVKAIDEALSIDDSVVLEEYIQGREFTVAVLEKEGIPSALPVIEIIPKAESYDFESKYAPGGSEHVCPAEISDDDTKKLQQNGVKAHKALGCRGVSRTDFIIRDDGTAWALETNTLPGMTPTSLLPDAAKASGLSFPELCELMVRNALADRD